MGQPSIQGTTIRWPELLIGRNSPSPCRTPRKKAWNRVIGHLRAVRLRERASVNIDSIYK